MSRRYSRVVAAVDFSKPARHAFDHALALSRKHEAELVVVHAVPLDESFGWHAADRLALIERLRKKAGAAGVAFRHRVQHGDPAEVVLLHADALRADVIVAGTHRRRGLDRLRTGSVGERIAARASMPVLLVPTVGLRGTVRSPRHVAVAVDFGAGSHQAVEAALMLAADPGDRVTLLHVVPGFSSGTPRHLYRYGIGEFQDELMREARQRLHALSTAHGAATAAVEARVLQGETATEVSRVVDTIGADLLVVGTTSRGAVGRALFGTTGTHLLRHTGVPMLTVPEVAPVVAHRQGQLPLAA